MCSTCFRVWVLAALKGTHAMQHMQYCAVPKVCSGPRWEYAFFAWAWVSGYFVLVCTQPYRYWAENKT